MVSKFQVGIQVINYLQLNVLQTGGKWLSLLQVRDIGLVVRTGRRDRKEREWEGPSYPSKATGGVGGHHVKVWAGLKHQLHLKDVMRWAFVRLGLVCHHPLWKIIGFLSFYCFVPAC